MVKDMTQLVKLEERGRHGHLPAYLAAVSTKRLLYQDALKHAMRIASATASAADVIGCISAMLNITG